uniref:Neutral protease 2 n=1 Tax=Colletotrichum fructicola (strain Nara gc5) TaxID=1213859 RepID=L2G6H0_COLFN
MKFLTGLSCFAALASAVVVDLNKRDSPLDVKIEAVGNSGVKASITNTGASDLKVFKTGSILDKLAVEKAEVFAGSEKVAFDGIRLRLQTAGLAEDAFEVIPAGQTVSVEWDVAEVHDLSAGGTFDVAAKGSFSYADADSTDIAGTAPFVRRDFHEHVKRTVVQSDCTGTQRTATTNALSNCRSLAAAASSAAVSGSAAKMTESLASGSTTSGVSRQYCTDIYPACSSGVIAYTLPSQSYMVNCPTFFTMTALSRTCHAQDQATTAVHEVTHLSQIKGTTDQSSCYGYSCVQSLTAAQNLNHADTYSLFANAIYVGC